MANFYKKSQIVGGGALQKKSQKGRSMIEMLGVLAIIGVLSIASISGYSKAMEKWKINKAIDQISIIIANVQTLFGGNTNNYSALGEKAYSLGVFPADMKKYKETVAFNVFGLGTWVYGSSDADYWVLDYYIPSRGACIAIASQNWGKEGILINGSIFIRNETPISISKANEACGNFADGDEMFIRLIFK